MPVDGHLTKAKSCRLNGTDTRSKYACSTEVSFSCGCGLLGTGSRKGCPGRETSCNRNSIRSQRQT